MVAALLACAISPAGKVDSADTGAEVDTVSDSAPIDSDSGADTDTDTGEAGDADGDGHLTPELGGDDCDDEDPWTFPGAQEWCDDTDQDCDGDPLADGVCGLTQPFTARAHRFNEGDGIENMLPVRDLTGDGHDDMLVWYMGATALAAGDGTLDAFATWKWVQEWGSSVCVAPDTRLDVGDIDGDGYNDLAVAEEYCYYGFEIYWGPITSGEESQQSTVWADDSDETTTGASNFRTADVNGDGFPDLTRIPTIYYQTLVTYFGGSRDATISNVQDQEIGIGQFTVSDRLGDVDGDGMDDIVWAGNWSSVWLSGADIPPSGTASIGDVGYGTFVDGDLAEETGPGNAPVWLPVGDLSGDGLGDVILAGSGSFDSMPDGGLQYYDTFRATDTYPSGFLVNDVSDDGLCHYPALLQHEDAPVSLFCNRDGYLVFPLEWRTGTWNLSETEYLYIDDDSRDPEDLVISGYAWGLGDLDEDGWSDVPINAQHGAWIFSPFDDIPWGQEQYW